MSKAKRKNSSYKTEPKKPVINAAVTEYAMQIRSCTIIRCLSLGFAYSRP